MTDGRFYRDFLAGVVGAVATRPIIVLLIAVVVTVVSVWYTANHIRIDTDNTDLLSAELPFRQDSIRLKESFPQHSNNIVIVIDAPTVDQADDAALMLGQMLRKKPKLFPWVFDPASDPWLQRHGLLFMEPDKLADLVDRLAASQAFLGRLWRDPSLRGLFDLLRQAIANSDEAIPKDDLVRVLNSFADAIGPDAVRPVSWQALLSDAKVEAQSGRRIILVQPAIDFGSLSPAADAMATIRTLAVDAEVTAENGFRVRLTGSAPLEQEELESVAEGMGLAGLISLVLVICLLWSGLRSPSMVIATLITLALGLIWTAGLAILVVGRLNLISVAFAVLFIGLSVDFGIHFALKLREALAENAQFPAAARKASRDVGGALTLCAAAAAIAFFSFVPTSYIGLAELGVIAGLGMVVALITNLTVLPALLSLFPPSVTVPGQGGGPSGFLFGGWQIRYAKLVLVTAAIFALVAVLALPSARFDFDPLNLRDRGTESVSTLFELMDGAESAAYSIEILAKGQKIASDMATRLSGLDSVERVVSLQSFLPGGQAEKLLLIEEAAFLLEPAFLAKRLQSPNTEETIASIRRFEVVARDAKGDLAKPLDRLLAALAEMPRNPAGLARLRAQLLGTLDGRLVALQNALQAGPVSIADIPKSLRAEYLDQAGQWRLQVFPKYDVRDASALREFVAEVTAIAPRATGSPVIIVAAGQAVVEAFTIAGTISVLAIAMLVILLLRSLRDVLLIFAPLLLAALATIAVTVLIDMPFNFANIIVLPLLFGLGVASAIHLVLRSRIEPDLTGLMKTSTPRAVLFSALTTIGSFASIAISSHPGTASMGVLLAIAISLTLVSTIAVLPAMIHVFGRSGTGDQ